MIPPIEHTRNVEMSLLSLQRATYSEVHANKVTTTNKTTCPLLVKSSSKRVSGTIILQTIGPKSNFLASSFDTKPVTHTTFSRFLLHFLYFFFGFFFFLIVSRIAIFMYRLLGTKRISR